MSLTNAERLLAVVAGWQAECAVQPHASHLAATRLNVLVDICPTSLAGCLEFGRKMLRVHIEQLAAKASKQALAVAKKGG